MRTRSETSGKSYTVQRVLDLFPPDAYYALTAMSDRALAYSTEPLKHRMFVVYEYGGVSGGEWRELLIRCLLSEGHIKYETVEKVGGKQQARLIEREGPTGLIVTTTATALHPENETRLLSLTANDTRDQTQAVLAAIAQRHNGRVPMDPDLSEFHALQQWLAEQGPHEVVIPFASRLAELIPPVAVRLRRDFSGVLALIQAHALLHRAHRAIDAEGRVIAEPQDYGVVRKLVLRVITDSVQLSVSQATRGTVEAVRKLCDEFERAVNLTQLAAKLDLDKSVVSRRVQVAIDAGYLTNYEERPGRPAKLRPGEPLPKDRVLLPESRELRSRRSRTRACQAERQRQARPFGESVHPQSSAGQESGMTEPPDQLRFEARWYLGVRRQPPEQVQARAPEVAGCVWSDAKAARFLIFKLVSSTMTSITNDLDEPCDDRRAWKWWTERAMSWRVRADDRWMTARRRQ